MQESSSISLKSSPLRPHRWTRYNHRHIPADILTVIGVVRICVITGFSPLPSARSFLVTPSPQVATSQVFGSHRCCRYFRHHRIHHCLHQLHRRHKSSSHHRPACIARRNLAAFLAVGTGFGVGVVVIALFTSLLDTIAADWVGRGIARIGNISRIGRIGWSDTSLVSDGSVGSEVSDASVGSVVSVASLASVVSVASVGPWCLSRRWHRSHPLRRSHPRDHH